MSVQSSILSNLRANLLEKTKFRTPEVFTIRGIWEFNMRSQPNSAERIFTDSGFLVATAALGASFSTSSTKIDLDALIGKDGRFIEVDDVPLQVAILDACYGVLPKKIKKTRTLAGSSIHKSIQRASIICHEVELLVQKYSISSPKILLIGVVQAIVNKLIEKGISTILSDLDTPTINSSPIGQTVHHGTKNKELIPTCDIIVMSGMTIATSTLDEIILCAKYHSKPMLIFAQTGSHFAEEYINVGIEKVVSENYPWYCLPGKSLINIY